MLLAVGGGEIGGRSDGRVEWFCNHGVGHTVAVPIAQAMGAAWWSHGCDGCCGKILEEFLAEQRAAYLQLLREISSIGPGRTKEAK